MNKKAQVTLIIAIAVFIVIIAGLIFYVANYYKKSSIEPLVFEKASIENYINNCIKKTAEDGLRQFGKQGFVVENVKNYEFLNISENQTIFDNSKIPSIEQIQNELSFYVDSNLNTCLKDFRDFKRQGWDVEKGNINAKTQINQEDVVFDVNFPIKVSDKVSTLNFDRFVIKLDIRLKYIYDLINKIVDFDSKYKRQVDMTMLNAHDVNVTIFEVQDSLVYVIDDSKSLIMNEPYRFVLSIK